MPTRRLLVTLSGEIHTKSRRTARWFRRTLRDNLQDAIARAAPSARLVEDGPRLLIEADTDQAELAAAAAARVFGVHRVDAVTPVPAGDLDALVAAVVAASREQVAGRRFAVRLRRRGEHPWSSPDACRRIGSELLGGSAGVDLDDPDVEIRVEVYGPAGYVVDRSWVGPAGAPVGTQPPVLSLLSGGFDSPVAAWMLLRRGSPVHFVHFQLECAASDQAMLAAWELWRRWGAGTSPTFWRVDFGEVREALFAATPSRLRQVVLKQLMARTADRLAERLDLPALVTGDSIGQVSSQTLRHVAEVDRVTDRPILRPLSGFLKDEIIERARAIGTADIAERSTEVCDLSDGPVAVAARRETLEAARAELPDDLVASALARCEVVALDRWLPGQPLVPVHAQRPAGVRIVNDRADLPPRDRIALTGRTAVGRATELAGAGRDVSVLWPADALAGVEPLPA